MEDQDKTKDQLIEELRIHQVELEMQNEELKRAYAELEESRNRFSDLYDLAPVGYLTVSDTGMIVDANLRAAHLLGLERSRLINSPFSRFVLIEDQDIFYLHRNNCLDQQVRQTCDIRMVKVDGTEFYAQLESAAVVADKEPRGGLRTSIIDITERKRMEKLVETANEAKFRSIFENSLDAMALVARDSGALDVNEAACEMFGATREELLGLGRDQILDVTDSRLVPALEQYRQQGHWRGRLNSIRRDGTRFPTEIAVRHFEDAQGTHKEVVGIRDITDRLRIEEELRQSEEKYRHLIENATDLIFSSDANGYFDFINAAALRDTGYSKEEVIGKHYLEFIPQDFRDDMSRFYGRQYVKRIPTVYVEYPYITKSGDMKWYGQTTRLIVEGDTVRGFVSVARDITELRHSLQALQDSEVMLKTILSTSPVGISMTQDRVVKWVNDAWLKMFGFKNEKECIGQSARIVYRSDEEFEQVGKALYEELGGATVTETDAKLQRKDGTIFDARVRMKLVETPGPEKVTIAAIADISDRKRADEALRESEQRFRRLFERHHAVMLLIEPDSGAIVDANSAAAHYYGYTRDELCLMAIQDINCLSPDEVYAERQRARHEHRNYFVFPHRLANGEIRTVEVHSSPIEMGNQTLLCSIIHDISDRIRVEQENRVLQSQLLQSQKMEAIGTLAGGVAHDFNNLLQIISGSAQLLSMDNRLNGTQSGRAQEIASAARRGADLVQRLLIFSRKRVGNPRPLNLNNEVAQTVKLLERTIPKMVAIELHVEDNLATVNADPVQIEQILMNLVLNAKDAMPQEGGRLTIETKNVDIDDAYCRLHLGAKPGSHVMLSVADTGCGMGEDTLQHVFEPFFTTKGVGKGTGLGLSVVFGIVEEHGGHITCKSVPGQGTTFHIYFPVTTDALQDATEQDVGITMGGSETILLVDDEADVMEVGAQVLTVAGYMVLRAASGLEAIELYKNQHAHISLVVLDLIMPEMGGIQLYQELMKMNPDLRVLISSGLISGGTVKDAEQLGARGFVQKPYDSVKLLNMVREALDAD